MAGLFNREKLYLSLPVALQNAIVSMEGRRLVKRRYDATFEEILRNTCKNNLLTRDGLLRLQRARLRAIIQSATTTSFWRDRFKKFTIDVNAGDLEFEIGKLPVLTKEEVKNSPGGLVCRNIAEETVLSHTSGTTGSGLVFPVTLTAEREQWAVWWRYRRLHGIDRNNWCGYFGGRSIVPLSQNRPPFWRVNKPGRQLMFSAYHLSRNTTAQYVKALVNHEIAWLHGYPSILALIAQYVIELKIQELPPIRIISTGAESLLPQQKEIIQEAFNARVVQHYGQAEGVANISECEHGSMHVDEDYSLVEFVPVENQPGSFRIVGTNWTNPAFPLIRYDTGDIATLSEAGCSCGSSWRVVSSIDGRKEDYLVLPNGVRIGRLDHIFKDLVYVREAQIVQSQINEAVFKVVKGSGYDSSGEEQKLLKEARQRLGDEIKISIEYVDKITRTRSGKLRFVISEIESGKLN
jgi:phenylacetate-CoA ligase